MIDKFNFEDYICRNILHVYGEADTNTWDISIALLHLGAVPLIKTLIL